MCRDDEHDEHEHLNVAQGCAKVHLQVVLLVFRVVIALGGGSSFAHPGSSHTKVDHDSVAGSVGSADSQICERMLS